MEPAGSALARVETVGELRKYGKARGKPRKVEKNTRGRKGDCGGKSLQKRAAASKKSLKRVEMHVEEMKIEAAQGGSWEV